MLMLPLRVVTEAWVENPRTANTFPLLVSILISYGRGGKEEEFDGHEW